jgi:hypothetical protein
VVHLEDPFEELDIAWKITSITLVSHVRRFEVEAAGMHAQLA